LLILESINKATEIDMYQGHLPDGSGVQRHSAGGLYPFVIFAQETPSGLQYGVIDPGQDGRLVGSYDLAHQVALAKLEWLSTTNQVSHC
jgi:hypothetical protein